VIPSTSVLSRSAPDFATDTRYRLFSTIDPYGTTVFASQCMPDLLQELRQLATERLTAVESRGLARLMALVEACGLGLGPACSVRGGLARPEQDVPVNPAAPGLSIRLNLAEVALRSRTAAFGEFV
jgi:hypothetical protein